MRAHWIDSRRVVIAMSAAGVERRTAWWRRWWNWWEEVFRGIDS